MSESFDVAVVGLGAMGAAAADALARAGQRVIGFDAHARNHALGSSHGRSRITRKAYLEGADYVPLVLRAYQLWHELEAETGQHLLQLTGGLLIGSPTSRTVAGALASARTYDLPHEYLDAAQVAERFPGIRLDDDQMAVYEPDAGVLDAEACVGAMLDRAAMHGAVIRHETPVRSWRDDGAGIRLQTDSGDVSAERLVIAVGPWAGDVLADLGLPLVVRRVVVAHFQPTQPEWYELDINPVYIWELADGTYFGFPNLPGQGIKVGYHDGGDICTPATIRREIDDQDVSRLRQALASHMPGAFGPTLYAVTCMYTNTPDRHFIVSQHTDDARIVYACGFSGHGFKFAPTIGEIVAEMAITGTTRHQIAFLSPDRFN